MKTTATKSLIDPTASVIDRDASLRSIKLIHRALLSHLYTLNQAKTRLHKTRIEDEPFDVEYDSTSQLCSDIGDFLKLHTDA